MDKRLRKQLAKVAIEKQRDRLERKMAYEMLLLASDRPFSELDRFWRLYHKDPDNVDRFFDFSLLNDYLQGET
jgi:ABC-type Fe3+/spermidine/putrescine transport system ATPase subunit